MTKYEKAINGKQENKVDLDESNTFDYSQPEPVFSEETYDWMEYIKNKDLGKWESNKSSKSDYSLIYTF